jgi:mono/diheme cytochrome c family protein
MLRIILLILTLVGASLPLDPARAQGKSLTLEVPSEIAQSGLWKFILPRFSLKTGIRVILAADGDMVLSATPAGAAVLEADTGRYYVTRADGPHAERFAEWLRSDVGTRTIESFQPGDGDLAFRIPTAEAVVETALVYEGDAAKGEDLSYHHCGRCHVVGARNRMNGLGSTPSFGLLRTLDDWPSRFEAFYFLKPHPAFTQITGITEPFPETRPSPIAPVEMTQDELDAILAFVSALAPADLGAPLQHQ